MIQLLISPKRCDNPEGYLHCGGCRGLQQQHYAVPNICHQFHPGNIAGDIAAYPDCAPEAHLATVTILNRGIVTVQMSSPL